MPEAMKAKMRAITEQISREIQDINGNTRLTNKQKVKEIAGLKGAPKEDMFKTPHILVAINYTKKNMPICMSVALLIQILGGLVLTLLVSKSKLEKFSDRMMLIGIAVIFAGIVCHLPNWLYWGFTPAYTALAFADLLIAWGIAGIWISKRA